MQSAVDVVMYGALQDVPVKVGIGQCFDKFSSLIHIQTRAMCIYTMYIHV
jgi:hypothetical protein